MEDRPQRIDVPKDMSYAEFTSWSCGLPTVFYGLITGPDGEQGCLSVIRTQNQGAAIGWRRIPTGLPGDKVGMFVAAARKVHDLELQGADLEVLRYAQGQLNELYSDPLEKPFSF